MEPFEKILDKLTHNEIHELGEICGWSLDSYNFELNFKYFLIQEYYGKMSDPNGEKWFKVFQYISSKGYLADAKPELKTSDITLDTIKCTDGWYELGNDLGFPSAKINDVFEYGEFGNIKIIVDEKLNIVGGRVIPFKTLKENYPPDDEDVL